MKIKDRILFYENGSPCIFFPAGDVNKGGTCKYMTTKCRKYCPSNGIINEHETRAYNYFCNATEKEIIARILKELKYFKSDMMGWFSWGDCPDALVNKIHNIVMVLKKEGITQTGFTRNKKLWDKLPCLPNLRFLLSIDSRTKAINLSSIDKLISYPDVDRGRMDIYSRGEHIGACGGYFRYDVPSEQTVEAWCDKCYKDRQGCFAD